MSQVVPWLALGSLTSGLVSVGFVRYLWPYRDRLGGRFFVATIGCEALWSLSYGVALFVFDPALRELFEVPIWFAINFIGVFFLAFALEYTGRSDLVRSRLMGGIVVLQSLHTLVVLTNPLHHVAWSDYGVEPIFGAATVSYAHQPWLFVNVTGVVLLIVAASFLLADTVFSYGPLYRKQAAAIALSPAFPGVPFLLWLVQVGASPPLNLTPLVFPVHLAFDMYAFFSRNMFEMVPAARRVAERAAIEDLGLAVVIVDADGRVIDSNGEAGRVLGVDADAMLGDPLDDHLPNVTPDEEGQGVSLVVDGRPREYRIATSPLRDSTGTYVGDSLVLQDVTSEVKREQRLAVLNRVLRHNLRNDLNVVHGFLGIARANVDDEHVQRSLRTAASKTADVMALGEKARDIEQVVEAAGTAESVGLDRVLADVVADLETDFPEATIRVEGATRVRVRGEERLVDHVLRNLLENGLEHAEEASPTTTVTVEPAVEHTGATGDGSAGAEGTVRVVVADDGPGIPAHELDALDATQETALEHGSGLGLWLVTWGVDALGGHVCFDADEEGTTVHLDLPAARTQADGKRASDGPDSTADARSVSHSVNRASDDH